jgi:hypothetical protein
MQNGITTVTGNKPVYRLNQLSLPQSIYVDDTQTIYVDSVNDRIIAGGNGKGNLREQLSFPTDVTVDKKNDSLIICIVQSSRLAQCSHQGSPIKPINISDIDY